MSATGLTVSVVVCAYSLEREGQLREAVTSVLEQSRPADEVIVVIDHNHELLKRVSEWREDIVVVPNDRVRGLSCSRDHGVLAASGDIVAFMDDDAVADVHWLSALLPHYDDPSTMGVGGSIDALWEAGRPGFFPQEFDWVVGCTYRGMPEAISPVRNVIGCNMSFRRELIATIGGFRNGVGRVDARPIGGEETDLCIRLRHRWPNRVILFDPSAIVRHHVPGHRGSWRYFVARCFGEGQSKAMLARLLGHGDSLESERAYTRRTLPLAARGELARALYMREIAGLWCLAAIVLGLSSTTLGYITGSIVGRREPFEKPSFAIATPAGE